MTTDKTRDILDKALKTLRIASIPLIIILAIANVACLAYIISIDNQPKTMETTQKASEYTHQSTWTYHAQLGNNTFYNNKKTLEPGEGPLYKNIVKNLTLYYNYDLTSMGQPIPHRQQTYQIIQLVAEEAFTKTLNDNETQRITQITNSQPIEIRLNLTAIQLFYEEIAEDTGTNTNTYRLQITTTTLTQATHHQHQIDESFIHTLKIDFSHSADEGSVIFLEEPTKQDTKDITKLVTVPAPENPYRDTLIITNIATGTLWISAVALHFKVPYQRKQKTEREKLISKHADEIIKSNKLDVTAKNTVEIDDIEKLKELSEYTMKPILYTETDEEIQFYVIDGDTMYRHNQKTEKEED